VRWLKSKAPGWKGDPATLGVLGSSTGGHIAELIGMKPEAPDAEVRYVATRSPISDPYARYQQAVKMNRQHMVDNTKNWFVPWETIYEANPQQMLDRKEKVSLPPLLIMQGSLDDNVLPALQEKFAASYRAAGGECRLEIFEGCEHLWVDKPGPATDRAHEMVKAFIAYALSRQSAALSTAANATHAA
jgi:acetyl esterase/lipase